MAAAPKQAGSKVSLPKALLRQAHERLERYAAVIPKFLLSDDPELIHDLRVRSRRLQQSLRFTLPRPKPRGARKVIKVLRRARQALGASRNLDVNLTLAQKRAEEAPTQAARDGWRALAEDLSEQRQSLIADARRRIAKHDFATFITRAQDALAQLDENVDRVADIKDRLTASLAEWDEAYALADATRGVEELHALRVAGKRLRYRAELLADAGMAAMKPMIKDLKQVQAALGDWHDRTVLFQCAAEFIRRPKFMDRRPALASALLAQLEEERKHAAAAVEELLRIAPDLRKRWTAGGISAPQ